MSLLNDLADFFSDNVTHAAATADDGFGNAGFAAGTVRTAHIGAGGELRTKAGEVQSYTTKGKVTFSGAYGIKQGDQLTLPTDFSPNVVIVEEAIKFRDEDGVHHDKIFF